MMERTTKEAGNALKRGSKKFKGEEAVKYYAQLVVTGLAILRQIKGDKFVDDFLLAAIGDKGMLTGREDATS